MIEIHCENCDCYQPLEQAPWTRDGDFEYQDQICSVCRLIVSVVRRPALETAPPHHGWRDTIKRDLSMAFWLVVLAVMAYVYYRF